MFVHQMLAVWMYLLTEFVIMGMPAFYVRIDSYSNSFVATIYAWHTWQSKCCNLIGNIKCFHWFSNSTTVTLLFIIKWYIFMSMSVSLTLTAFKLWHETSNNNQQQVLPWMTFSVLTKLLRYCVYRVIFLNRNYLNRNSMKQIDIYALFWI